ncbi:actin-7-related [Anaeramoeba ignava]|uniref:Actin-7-related n=1 Tax=Anaeramoeba ignava TaxID=1746090 RepID=A0A9Q0R5D3_ANAIG|nr:actin-7-related [Anaeramoeba ignava]
MDDFEEKMPIVIDNGSGFIKSGFGGEEEPKSKFTTIIGKPKHLEMIKKINTKKYYIGNEAENQRGILELEYPMERGIVRNWDNMEKIWDYIFFNELKVEPEDQPLLLSEVPMNPKSNREKITEIMFEVFHVPSFYISLPGILALYSSGRTTGIVIDIGDGVTYTLPAYEGFILRNHISRANFGGTDLTDYLINILNEKDLFFTTSAERETAKDIKEKLGYSTFDFNQEMILSNSKNHSIDKNYELPDGQVITIGNERFRCAEVLFNPSLMGIEQPGIHQIVSNSIQKCDIDIQRDLLANIIFSGGSTLFPGISDRFVKELVPLFSPVMRIMPVCPPERQFSVWIGGSILTTLSSSQSMWIPKSEFEEVGNQIIHQKCF